jgi:hypothetical protein
MHTCKKQQHAVMIAMTNSPRESTCLINASTQPDVLMVVNCWLDAAIGHIETSPFAQGVLDVTLQQLNGTPGPLGKLASLFVNLSIT